MKQTTNLVLEVLISPVREEILDHFELAILTGTIEWRCVSLSIEYMIIRGMKNKHLTLLGELTTNPMLTRYLTSSR